MADASCFYQTSGPQVGSGLDFKPSKPYYGFKYDLRHITQHSIGEENGLRYKLGRQCAKFVVKIFKNWLTHPVFTKLQALREGLVYKVSLAVIVMAAVIL